MGSTDLSWSIKNGDIDQVKEHVEKEVMKHDHYGNGPINIFHMILFRKLMSIVRLMVVH